MDFAGVVLLNSILKEKIDRFLHEELEKRGYIDIHPSQGDILYQVYKYGGKIQIKEIFELLNRSKSTLSEAVKKLIKNGYLEKIPDSNDKRVNYIILTKKGLAFKNDFLEISDLLISRCSKNLNEEEKQNFICLIEKINNNF